MSEFSKQLKRSSAKGSNQHNLTVLNSGQHCKLSVQCSDGCQAKMTEHHTSEPLCNLQRDQTLCKPKASLTRE